MLLRNVLSVLLCLLMITVSSQSIIPRFETIGVNEGLSQSSVYSIYQDQLGFMWFGTADGLNRYDGSEIKIYKNKERLENSGNSNLIRGKMCEDKQHNIWFATETGLYYFDRLNETIKSSWLFPKQSSGILYYELVYMDKQQNLWLFNKSVGFIAVNAKTGLHSQYGYTFTVHQSTALSDAVVDWEGKIWFNFYPGGGFYCFHTGTHRFDLFFEGKDYLNIFFGKEKMYTVSASKVYCFNKKFQKQDSMDLGYVPTNISTIHNVYEDRLERLWLPSSTHGLICYDFKQKKRYRYIHDNSKPTSLSSNYATVVVCDRSENLWIGTDGGGVCKLDLKPSRFNLFPLNESDYSLKEYFIKCIYEDDRKRIWFGTNSDGLCIYDPEDRSLKSYLHEERNPSSLPGNNVGAIFKDRQGNVWIGCDMGIALFHEKEKAFKLIDLKFPVLLQPNKTFVYRMEQLQNNDLVAMTAYGMVRIQKDSYGKFSGSLEFQPPKKNFWCIDMAEMSNHDIWIAGPLNGLFHAAPNDKNGFVVKEKFFSGIDLRSIHQDETDPAVLWLASGKGLIQFNTQTKQFRVFNEENGMANSYVYGVLEDENHNFWMSTNGGLIHFDRSKNSFQNFRVNDGLQSNEFNTGAFYKGASGNFYFGGIKGFNWFKTVSREAEPFSYKPAVAITNIVINDQPFQKDAAFAKNNSIHLTYNKNNISFGFAALDFTRPAANKIFYKLEGWDPHWFSTQAKTIRYPNLPPGNYVLKIKAVNGNDIFSEEQSISVIIETPFWQQRWFYFLVSIIILAMAITTTKALVQRKLRQRLREVEKQRAIELERNRISRDMHDEIGSGLTHIALMSELLQTQKKADEELRKDVGTISSSARKLVESMSEIIWALNPQNDTLENLLAYLREQTLTYFEPFDVQYTISFPDYVPAIKLTNEQRRNLFLVAKEALNNALKHSRAQQIDVSMEYKKGNLHFYIRDNGKGFATSHIKTACNGLRNMEKRMRSIGGDFNLQTGKEGTFIHFNLKLGELNKIQADTTFFTSEKEQ